MVYILSLYCFTLLEPQISLNVFKHLVELVVYMIFVGSGDAGRWEEEAEQQ